MNQQHIGIFESERRVLLAIAYRMLGERGAAEDIVQEAWLQWQQADRMAIQTPAAWLKRVVSRLSIDQLRSARVRRETYVGPWLPEPLPEDVQHDPADSFKLARECELALLWAMERLSPEQRSAFILREVFDSDYAEIAEILGRSESTCRKLVSRAKQQIKETRPRFQFDAQETAEMLGKFSQACVAQDHAEVLKLLAPDVVALSDGGGKARAALRPLTGRSEVSQVVMALAGNTGASMEFELSGMNGQPALLISENSVLVTISTIRLNQLGLIDWIYALRNPEKLSR